MPKTNVFITVDTEHSIGGAFADATLNPVGNEKRIFGRLGDKEFGIPLIMDIADRYGLRVVFFVEVLNHYFFGHEETREVVEYILRRGHEVQLHLHPNYLNFTLDAPQKLKYSDLCGDYLLTKQVELLAEGKQLLRQYGAPEVTAFRAGCFGADEQTLLALLETGFLIDSSYNNAYLNGPCLLPDWRINDLAERGMVYEFPVTNFREKTGLRSSRSMPLDINGVSFEEMRFVLESARRGDGPNNMTIILHSFSFVKAYDVQYRRARPRREVIRRFEKLCRYLAEHTGDFKVQTYQGLTRQDLQQMVGHRNDCFPEVPAVTSIGRFGGQLLDRL